MKTSTGPKLDWRRPRVDFLEVFFTFHEIEKRKK